MIQSKKKSRTINLKKNKLTQKGGMFRPKIPINKPTNTTKPSTKSSWFSSLFKFKRTPTNTNSFKKTYDPSLFSRQTTQTSTPQQTQQKYHPVNFASLNPLNLIQKVPISINIKAIEEMTPDARKQMLIDDGFLKSMNNMPWSSKAQLVEFMSGIVPRDIVEKHPVNHYSNNPLNHVPFPRIIGKEEILKIMRPDERADFADNYLSEFITKNSSDYHLAYKALKGRYTLNNTPIISPRLQSIINTQKENRNKRRVAAILSQIKLSNIPPFSPYADAD